MFFIRLRSWLTIRPELPLASLRQRFLALDLETTGLDVRRDTVVSLAAIPFVAGAPGAGYVTLVDPGRPIPAQSAAIHGLTDTMVRGAPSVGQVLHEAEAMVAGQILVGHNIDFDLTILARARRACQLPRLSNLALDTRLIAAGLHPQWRDFSVEHVADRLGVTVVARHTAEGDAVTAGRILLALLPGLEARRLRTVSELLWLQRRALLG